METILFCLRGLVWVWDVVSFTFVSSVFVRFLLIFCGCDSSSLKVFLSLIPPSSSSTFLLFLFFFFLFSFGTCFFFIISFPLPYSSLILPCPLFYVNVFFFFSIYSLDLGGTRTPRTKGPKGLEIK